MIHHSCPVLPPAGSVDRSQPLVDFITSNTHARAHSHTHTRTQARMHKRARERAHAAAHERTFARTATKLRDVTVRQRWRARARSRRKMEKSLCPLRVSCPLDTRVVPGSFWSLPYQPPLAPPPPPLQPLPKYPCTYSSRLLLAPRCLLFL